MRPETALLETLQRPTPNPHGYAGRYAGGIAAVVPVEVRDEHAAERLAVLGQVLGELAVDDGRRALESGQNGGVEGRGKVDTRTQVLGVSLGYHFYSAHPEIVLPFVLDDEDEDGEHDGVVLVRPDPVGLDCLRQVSAVQHEHVAGAISGRNEGLSHDGLVGQRWTGRRRKEAKISG